MILQKKALTGDGDNCQPIENPPYNYENTLIMKSKHLINSNDWDRSSKFERNDIII